ncbi:hypothetical protein AB833_18270 [Chromatiales bacterium (ex Bugula neritina AB1)]|nr:hypothetical protein AB833_18270 [Chromatiales bacterium (ex Bugula neritina AB1)]
MKQMLRTPLFLLSCVLVFSFSAYQCARLSHQSEQKSFEQNAAGIANDIYKDLLSIVSDLRSIGSLHQTSPNGFNYAQHEHISATLAERITAVDASVRFDHIDHIDLPRYVEELREQGMFSFQPKFIDTDGKIVALPARDSYLSVISYNPGSPSSNRFIGLDLLQLPQLRSAIKESVARYNVVAIAAPDNWVNESDLLILFPSFYGNQIPADPESRLLQTDGGYLVSISLERILKKYIPAGTIAAAELHSAQSNSEYKALYNESEKSSDASLMNYLFKPAQLDYRIPIGHSALTIYMSSPASAARYNTGTAIAVGLVCLFIYAALVSAFSTRKRSMRTLAEKDSAIAREKERAQVTLRSINDAVITADSNNSIDYINPAAERLLNLNPDKLLSTNLFGIVDLFTHPEQIGPLVQTGADFKKPTSILEESSPSTLLTKDGLVVSLQVSALYDAAQNLHGTVVTMRDISKEHALTSELAHQATHDALTGIANRRHFENSINQLLGVKSENVKYAVSYIDLDQFKLINDTAGHAVGDELLIKLSNDLTSQFSDAALLARLGGDEFGLILSAQTEAQLVARVSDLYAFFQTYYFKTEQQFFSVRACIGMTHIRDHHRTMNDVLSEVDLACYAAKDSGRNTLHIYDPDNKDTRQRQGEMQYLPILQTALKENRFILYVQAIAPTDDVDIFSPTHYECLLRIPGENGQVITPFKFILAAERYEMMRDIDRWVIHHAFEQISSFRHTIPADHRFSINLSGQSAVDDTLPSFIQAKLTEFRIAPQTICFELTETAVISNLSQAQQLIGYLRETGCSIALDDFGSGVCSFGYLKNLQVDYLKIDGQFVKDITHDPIDLEMVRSINNVGKALGIKTIAEFVETREVMQTLAGLSVDYAQGYYISKPFPLTDLLQDIQLPKVA